MLINMFNFAILLALIAYALAAAVPKGMLPQFDGRIVDGKPISISSVPWQVSLQRSGSHFCGGSIIGERVILSAAHCLVNANKVTLRVRAGSSFWISGGVFIHVESYTYHENYNPFQMTNDVAVMILKTSLVFSSTIRPIRLATIAPEDSAPALVSGWGTTISGSSSTPTQLKVVEMMIVGQSKCASEAYRYGTLIQPTMICTYSVGKDSCQGDSGGPLVSGGELVGVVSWGVGCGFENYPGVYADVAQLHSWVAKNANISYTQS